MTAAEWQFAAERLRELIKRDELHEDSVKMLKEWLRGHKKVLDFDEYRNRRK